MAPLFANQMAVSIPLSLRWSQGFLRLAMLVRIKGVVFTRGSSGEEDRVPIRVPAGGLGIGFRWVAGRGFPVEN